MMWSILMIGLMYAVLGDGDGDYIRASLTVSEADLTPRHLGTMAEIAHLADHYTQHLIGQLRYTLLTSGAGGLFVIDDVTGELTLTRTPDRDLWCPRSPVCERPLLVSLSSIEDRTWMKVIRISVKVIDVNDNAPAFPEPVFNINVPEDSQIGTQFHISMATDLDTAANGVNAYEIISSSSTSSSTPSSDTVNSPAPFKLFTTKNSDDVIDSLTLVLTSDIDRELTSGYTIDLVATDSGGLSGSLTVVVSVSDVDDNIPLFSMPSISLEVEESEHPGKVLLEVKGVDLDIGRNGEMVYTLTPSSTRMASGNFRLNSTNGQLSVGPLGLDFETRPKYELVVQVSAANSPGKVTDSLTIYIDVLDRNDEVPVIAVTFVNSRLEENMTPGQRIALFSVTDDDTGDSGEFTCTISGQSFLMRDMGQGIFLIESRREFDREKELVMSTNITCTDRGSPPLTSVTPIQIQIIDINDNPPVFRRPEYEVSITENNDPEVVLLTVEADDADSEIKTMLTFTLIQDVDQDHENDVQVLKIDTLRGTIKSMEPLDREKYPDGLKAIVEVSDGAVQDKLSNRAQVPLHIRLLDVNDSPPEFPNPMYTFSTPENKLPGLMQCVGQRRLTASDPDLGQGAWFFETDSPAFSVHSVTGDIRTKVQLDRENQATYEFVVRVVDADDSSLYSTAKIIVNVEDENDHRPEIIFPASNHVITVNEDAKVGDLLTPIRGVDLDSGDNSRLRYSLLTGSSPYFRLTSDTGHVTVSELWPTKPDHVKQFQLFIGVRDCGLPVLVGASTVYRITKVVAPDNSSITKDADSRHHRRQHSAGGSRRGAVALLVGVATVGALTIAALSVAIAMVNRQDKMDKLKLATSTPPSGDKPFHQIKDVEHFGDGDNPCFSDHHQQQQQHPSRPRDKISTVNDNQRQHVSPSDLHLGLADDASDHSTETSNTDSGRGSNDDHNENNDNNRIRNINNEPMTRTIRHVSIRNDVYRKNVDIFINSSIV